MMWKWIYVRDQVHEGCRNDSAIGTNISEVVEVDLHYHNMGPSSQKVVKLDLHMGPSSRRLSKAHAPVVPSVAQS